MGDRDRPAIVVVGSINLDLVVPVPHHPRSGETVLGGDHLRGSGGKGANQAVAAARLGRHVAIVGAVGSDAAGRELTDALDAEGIDLARVRRIPDIPTGIALISVDDHGENAIVVSPGANARVGVEDIEAAASLLTEAPVTLLQLEIPIEAVIAAARIARGTVILNPAPARYLPAELMHEIDVLVPNAGELADLTGTAESDDLGTVAESARGVRGSGSVVVTLGSSGALIVGGDGTATRVPAFRVTPVDTTAAGDSFCGALAVGLVEGRGLEEAATWAAAAAALTVTKRGAQASLPGREEVEEMLGSGPDPA